MRKIVRPEDEDWTSEQLGAVLHAASIELVECEHCPNIHIVLLDPNNVALLQIIVNGPELIERIKVFEAGKAMPTGATSH